MITIISSAKTMDFTSIKASNVTQPYFTDEAAFLANECKKLNKEQLMSAMDINKKLAESTYESFLNYDNAIHKPALFAYDGDVFKQLRREEYSESNLDFIQQHLCIISGLYGALKPLDLIASYRLEMAVNLNCNKVKSLYGFWSGKVTEHLNLLLSNHKSKFLLNLASIEYSKIVDSKNFNYPIISVIFNQLRDNKMVNIGVLAKKARGKMLDFIIKNNIDDIEDLKMFNLDGYSYNQDLSKSNNIVFLMDNE